MLARNAATLILLALFTSILLLVRAQEPQQRDADGPSSLGQRPPSPASDGASSHSGGTQLLAAAGAAGGAAGLPQAFAWRRTGGHVSNAAGAGGGGLAEPQVAARSGGAAAFPGLDVSAEDNASFDPRIYAAGRPAFERRRRWMPQAVRLAVQLQSQLETTAAQPWDSYARLHRRHGASLLQAGPPPSLQPL